MVPQMVTKIAICNYYLMASGNYLVVLIAKLVNMGGVYVVGSGH